MAEPDISDLKHRMDGAINVLRSEFGGLRTGRASASLLDRACAFTPKRGNKHGFGTFYRSRTFERPSTV